MVKILIVDDEEHILAAMSEYFAALGYEVACARETSAAQALLEQSEFRIVITDLRLSGSDRYEGLEIVEHVQSRDPHIECIILTAYGSPDNETRARQAGASTLLQKPQPLGELSRIVRALIEDRSAAPFVAWMHGRR